MNPRKWVHTVSSLGSSASQTHYRHFGVLLLSACLVDELAACCIQAEYQQCIFQSGLICWMKQQVSLSTVNQNVVSGENEKTHFKSALPIQISPGCICTYGKFFFMDFHILGLYIKNTRVRKEHAFLPFETNVAVASSLRTDS